MTTGLYAAIGILMALAERQKSGLGQFIETTLYETGLAIMHPHAANYFMHGKPPELTGNEHPNLVPYAIFPTRIDNIFIGVGNDATFRKLCKELGKPELGTDPRFARNKDRIDNREALRVELAAVLSQHEAEPLCDRLLAAGLPAGPVQSIDQALANAHAVHRGDIVEQDWYKGVASPIRFLRTKACLRSVPPKFSEHADEVLRSSAIRGARSTTAGRAWSAGREQTLIPSFAPARNPLTGGVHKLSRNGAPQIRGPACCDIGMGPACESVKFVRATGLRRARVRDYFPASLPSFPSSFAYTVICTSSGAVIARKMMTPTGRSYTMAIHHFGSAAAFATTLALAAPAQAVTEIQWWHAMTGGNNDVVNKLAEEFNARQSDYKVVPSFKGGYADTMNAGIAAFRAGNAPHIMQVFEVGTATMMSPPAR